MRQLYHIAGCLTNQQSSSNQPIRNLHGALLTSNDDQTRRWKKHFEAVSSSALSSESNVEVGIKTTSSKTTTFYPILAEIKGAIKKLKWAKMAYSQNYCSPTRKFQRKFCIATVWDNEKLPPSWTKGVKVKLPKRSDLRD